MRLAVVAIVLLLSGCVQSPTSPSAPERAAAASLKLGPCDTVRMIAELPSAAARALLPPAFEPVAAQDDRVEVIFGALSCEGDGAHSAFVEITAQPRNASWRDPNVTRAYFEPELDVQPGDGYARAWDATGGIAWNATVTASPSGVNVKAANFTHTLALTSSPGAPGGAQLAPGISREWAAARGGYAFLDAAFDGGTLQAGVAQLQAGAGTPAAKLFGESATEPAIALLGTTYAGARVEFVAGDAT